MRILGSLAVFRGLLVRLSLIWCLSAGTIAHAETRIFVASGDTAINGYDVVSYFSDAGPQPGDPTHSVVWKGVVWQFISDENRQRFEANPRAFAPQFGGYCAYGVSKGVVLHTDPTLWYIYEGKLYLIHDRQVWPIWIKDVPGYVQEAGSHWPEVLASR
jgi:hypothetical protein